MLRRVWIAEDWALRYVVVCMLYVLMRNTFLIFQFQVAVASLDT